MSTETSQLQQMKPYIIIASVLFVILLVVIFWPTSEEKEPISVPITDTSNNPALVAVPAKPIIDANEGIDDMVDPSLFEAPRQPSAVELDGSTEVEEFKAEEVVVEVPLDTSDATVKTALIAVAKSPTFGRLLVNERLIEKFVINVHNLANADMSPKDSLVTPPTTEFKTYQQAQRVWIDNASFKRYNPYVDALESMEVDELLSVFDTYKTSISEKYAEISRPGQQFDDALIDAIDVLLDTPQVPVPIEVYSESVMYKFKDERLEGLSGPQKQLLRTGPENMRRIKEVLRKLKTALEQA